MLFHEIKNKWNYYDLPLESSKIGIYLSDGVCAESAPRQVQFEEIAGKLQSYQINKDEILFIPQIRHLNFTDSPNTF